MDVPPIDKQITIHVKPAYTIPSLFRAATAEEGVTPDEKLLSNLLNITNRYIDAVKSSTKAKLVQAVDSFLREAELKDVSTDVPTVLSGQLADVWGKAKKELYTIIDTQAQTAKNVGSLDGIAKIAAASGDEDPTVAFLAVYDEHTCKECKRLHFIPGTAIPRVWKMSELKQSYAKKGDDSPSIHGQHPHCRGTLAYIAPGYGFKKDGMLTYVGPSHDEFVQQRGGVE